MRTPIEPTGSRGIPHSILFYPGNPGNPGKDRENTGNNSSLQRSRVAASGRGEPWNPVQSSEARTPVTIARNASGSPTDTITRALARCFQQRPATPNEGGLVPSPELSVFGISKIYNFALQVSLPAWLAPMAAALRRLPTRPATRGWTGPRSPLGPAARRLRRGGVRQLRGDE